MKNKQKVKIPYNKGVDNSISWRQNRKALVAISPPDRLKRRDGSPAVYIRNHRRRAQEAGRNRPNAANPGRPHCHYAPGRATLGHSAAPPDGDHPILTRRLWNSRTKSFIIVHSSHGRSAARGNRGRGPPTATWSPEYSWLRQPEKGANPYRAVTRVSFGIPSTMFPLTSTLLICASSRAPPQATPR